MTTATFETGKLYEMRFITDSDLRVPVKVIKRTAKTATIELHNETKRCKIHMHDNSEYIFPEGSYSMAPTARAKNIVF